MTDEDHVAEADFATTFYFVKGRTTSLAVAIGAAIAALVVGLLIGGWFGYLWGRFEGDYPDNWHSIEGP